MRNARGATGALARAILASGERLSGPRYAALARIAVHDDSGGGARGEVAAATAAAAAASRKGASSSSLDAELSELVLNDGGIDATLRWLTAAREPSTAAFVPLIEAAVSCGDEDALLTAGGLMRERGVRPDAALYTALILGRLRLGQTERALSACDKCLSDGVVPESRALTALVRALADASETEAAISLCRRLRRRGLRLRGAGPAISSLIAAAARCSAAPFEAVAVMQEREAVARLHLGSLSLSASSRPPLVSLSASSR
mmetsp:Transcript_34598/g.115570  ORF Transcript_34598/g.115570 Transcript_34598/m.115570 type:complete len:260 (+) Transcript_34598:93-872(+)